MYVCAHAVQWLDSPVDVIKDPCSEGLGFNSMSLPGFRTQLHVNTSFRTGEGPVSCVQLSEGGDQVVYPLGLWSRFSGIVKFLFGCTCG